MARKKKYRPGPPNLPRDYKVEPLRSFMRSKSGKSTCEKCEGKGCYSCDKLGYYYQCPNCANEVREMIYPQGDANLCHVCDTYFTDSGEIRGIKETQPPSLQTTLQQLKQGAA